MTEPGKHSEGSGRERLPKFLSFEERAREAGPAGLSTAVKRISYPENSLDSDEAGAMWFALAWPYAGLLRENPDKVVAVAAYNGLYFATAVGSYLVGSRRLPPYPFDPDLDKAVEREQILQAQQTYLEDKPTLKTWIDQHMAALDPSGTCADVVTAVFSVALSKLEELERQEFIEAVVMLDMDDI